MNRRDSVIHNINPKILFGIRGDASIGKYTLIIFVEILNSWIDASTKVTFGIQGDTGMGKCTLNSNQAIILKGEFNG